MTTRSLLLLSGGLDSITVGAMAHARDELSAALIVDYGQPHARWEIPRAVDWCAAHGVQALHATLPLPGVEVAMAIGYGVSGPRVVHGRNLTLISVAISRAVEVGANTVLVGCNADDAADYPDCREVFIDALDRLAFATYGVHVRAPLIGCSKAQVGSLARLHGVRSEEAWSCYQPIGPEPCGTCNACIARARAGV